MASRRRLLASLVALIAVCALAPRASSSSGLPAKLDPRVLTGPSPRAIVGFEHPVGARTLRKLAAVGITRSVVLHSIDAVGVLGPRAAYRAIARWTDVTYVDNDSPLHVLNYATKKDTRVVAVRKGAKPLHRKYTGKGVTVAIVDTGINDNHPDLQGRVVQHLNFEPAYIFDAPQNGTFSDRIAEATGNPLDELGHGTHVAGIVAGSGASGSGADFSGVAPDATLIDAKVAGSTESVDDVGWEINALVAYEYLIEHRHSRMYPGGIRIISNSWAIYEADSDVEPISLIVQAAARKGIVSVFAAGNAGPGDNTVEVGPNRLPEVITVAAACKSVDSCGSLNIASFSSRGPQVDVAAPGDSVYSTNPYDPQDLAIGIVLAVASPPPGDPQNGFFYIPLSGTSMATPHVSGIVALMLQANPKLTRQQVQKIISSTARDRGSPGVDHAWGHGLVDAFAAVAAAERLR